MQLGEAFVGEGAEAAHVNTVLGHRVGPTGTAWATALATPTAGHVPFVAVLAPGVPVQPMTLFVNKATIASEAHGHITWGAAQAGVAASVADAVADGFVQRVWSFGGTVPGPVIRVKVGDTIRIHLKNPATNLMPHSVDFHASQVAWNDEMTSLKPGEEKLYEFTASRAGVFMYHCGTAPALHHIANGMYGMIIVEPKGGLEPVDAEFFIVQSEWYLGPQGKEADLAKASEAAPAPDFVLFNGVANQYKDGPIQVATGKRVRVFVLDAGPNIDSSFHIVGTIFNTVIKDVEAPGDVTVDDEFAKGFGLESLDKLKEAVLGDEFGSNGGFVAFHEVLSNEMRGYFHP